jgi:hypothetical protein
MMTQKLDRRDFLIKGSTVCLGSCILLSGRDLAAAFLQDDKPIVPSQLCYCSYSCPEDCEFLVATLKNDPELKKEVYEKWDLKGRYGLKFDAEKIFCFKCKPGDQPEGPVLTNCTVRSCAIEKGYQACIQCDELKTCEKDLWKRFPQFHEAVVKMQEKYLQQV